METNNKRPKPVVLVIFDGWGIYQPYSGNAIALAKTPTYDSLVSRYPSTTLGASGESVGLPWGEEGNSEVGHMNMGLGRIVYQALPRINKSIMDNSIYENGVLLKAVENVKKRKTKMHVMGLVSSGGVHSSLDHLHALIKFMHQMKVEEVCIHAFLDGRDAALNSAVNFINGLQHTLKEHSNAKIASLSGRFYAMDRNNNWDRTEKAFVAMTKGEGQISEDVVKAINDSYKKKIYDEEFIPTVIHEDGKPVGLIEDGDSVVFFNFRPDRARQITKALVLPNFDKFKRDYFKNLYFACFTEYEKGLPINVIFPPVIPKNSLGEVISDAGLKQLRIAETEKYAHVTYFFNGGRETKSPGEDHILIPSPNVSSYDEKPEMSAPLVTKNIVEQIEQDKYDFIVVNYANPDMVGHTGNMDATIKGIEALDKLLAKLVKAVLDKNGVMMLTGDHGNAEILFNMQHGQKDKEHSTNPVPFILVANKYEGLSVGWQDVPGADLSIITPIGALADIAPTIIDVMGLSKPEEMTGRNLIRK